MLLCGQVPMHTQDHTSEFLVALLLQGVTLLVTLCQLSVHSRTLPPMKTSFLGSSGNFKQLSFFRKVCFFIIFFHLQKNFPTSTLFCISRCFIWHPECSTKNFTPIFFSSKIFLQWAVGEARCDTMQPVKHSSFVHPFVRMRSNGQMEPSPRLCEASTD